MDRFTQENVDILALSADPLDKAREMVERVHATFPIGFRLKVPEDADKVGAYWEDRRKIIHATAFIIDADKRVADACYSNGPIGRIVAADALSHIQFFKKRKQQS